MKKIAPLAIGLAAAFMLSACKQEETGTATDAANTTNRQTNVTLQEDRFLRHTFDITTHDGRNLQVSATAYCQTLEHLRQDAYVEQCTDKIAQRLNYHATQRDCFEGLIAAVDASVRNHEGLHLRDNTRCLTEYPATTAPFPEDMMRRTLLMRQKDDLYTVTRITPVSPR